MQLSLTRMPFPIPVVFCDESESEPLAVCSVGCFISLLVREEVLLTGLCERKILFQLKIYDSLRHATSKQTGLTLSTLSSTASLKKKKIFRLTRWFPTLFSLQYLFFLPALPSCPQRNLSILLPPSLACSQILRAQPPLAIPCLLRGVMLRRRSWKSPKTVAATTAGMAVWARPCWEWTQNVMTFLLLPTVSSMVMGRGIQLELQPSPLNSSPSYCTSKPIW